MTRKPKIKRDQFMEKEKTTNATNSWVKFSDIAENFSREVDEKDDLYTREV